MGVAVIERVVAHVIDLRPPSGQGVRTDHCLLVEERARPLAGFVENAIEGQVFGCDESHGCLQTSRTSGAEGSDRVVIVKK